MLISYIILYLKNMGRAYNFQWISRLVNEIYFNSPLKMESYTRMTETRFVGAFEGLLVLPAISQKLIMIEHLTKMLCNLLHFKI